MIEIKKTPKKGERILYTGNDNPIKGTIVSYYYGRLKVKFDGHNFISILHPTWCIEYLGNDSEEEKLQVAEQP